MAKKKRSARHRAHSVPQPTTDEILRQLNTANTNFLKIDLETALTFTEIALQARDEEKKVRNRRSARKAYDTVLRLVGRVNLSEQDAQMLMGNLQRLKTELMALGEVF